MNGYVTQTDYDELKARADVMVDALIEIRSWSLAYPRDIFIPPTVEQCAEAHAALAKIGMSLDKFSAHAMRHIAEGVGKIVDAALTNSH